MLGGCGGNCLSYLAATVDDGVVALWASTGCIVILGTGAEDGGGKLESIGEAVICMSGSDGFGLPLPCPIFSKRISRSFAALAS